MPKNTTQKFLGTFVHNKLSPRKRPFFGSIEATRRCNSHCMFCPIGSEKPEFKQGEMNTEQFCKVLDRFAEYDLLVASFLGGEPTLRKDFAELGQYGKSKGLLTQAVTNGITLADNADAYTKAIDNLVVSMDTVDPEKYRDIRGVDKFDQVVEGIKEAVKVAKKNECVVLVNTVICAKNMNEIEKVVKFSQELGASGIMLDFATFHDNWMPMVEPGTRYNPEATDWRKNSPEVQKLVHRIIQLKNEYPILTSRSYLRTFLTGDFDFRCYPHLFCCVNLKGEIALPCWDSPKTKFYSLLDGRSLDDIYFSEEVVKARAALKDCSMCYMHCIVEPSKVIGEPMRNLVDLMEWVSSIRKHGSFV